MLRPFSSSMLFAIALINSTTVTADTEVAPLESAHRQLQNWADYGDYSDYSDYGDYGGWGEDKNSDYEYSGYSDWDKSGYSDMDYSGNSD